MVYLNLLFLVISAFLNSGSYAETDTLKAGQLLHDWEQLVSAGGVFRLGFFNPNPPLPSDMGSSGPRFLGIWFDEIPFYSVWVANRENPVPDSSGTLSIDTDGKLNIKYQNGTPIVVNSKQLAIASGGNFSATLLNSGNLVIRQVYPDGKPGRVLWQSFDYPHNILLPGMKLGMNFKTGHNWTLTSWISDKFPAPGPFQLGLDPSGTDQLLVWRRGEVYWSSGVLLKNGSFELAPVLTWMADDVYEFKFVRNKEERYFTYSVKYKSVLSRFDVDTTGQLTLVTVDRRGQNSRWIFDTASPCTYDAKNSTSICITEKPVKCRKGSEFFDQKRVYVGGYEFEYYDPDENLSISDCHAQCWRNCSCVAFRSFNGNGTGCQFWKKGAEFIPGDNFEYVYILTQESNEKRRP